MMSDNGVRESKVRLRGVKWWNLANSQDEPDQSPLLEPAAPVYMNPSLQTLTRKQRRLVSRNPGILHTIKRSAAMAAAECSYQFHSRRWNCPIEDDSHGGSIYGKIIRKGFRETAFIYAITSAALTHYTSRDCSQGGIYTCSCGDSSNRHIRQHSQNKQKGVSDWKWGGCSDNVKFGHKFSRDFIDKVEKGRDLRYMMNLHNNEAGRVHVTRELRQECKCHGMSGSCTMKTCWMRLPHFRSVSEMLKERFDGASKVITDNTPNRRDRQGKSRQTRRVHFNLLPVDPLHKHPSSRDLVYYENSPSFCDREKTISYGGTKGRECNATAIGVHGCDLMCCGRGSRPIDYEVKERCNCTFHWCCEVNCQTCMRTKRKHVCL